MRSAAAAAVQAKYILALDQGTTSSRAIVFDRAGTVVSMAQREFRQLFPQPGWVEHDPVEIWTSQSSVAKEALDAAGAADGDVAAIGITNQRETAIVWDRDSGRPICSAIVWQDRRTADACESLKKRQLERTIRRKTGLVVDPYFSATKLQWILQHVPGALKKAREGRLAFGTVDTWLLWNLTGGRCHMTDVTNASRTMLCNIRTGEWDGELLKMFGVPRAILPEIRSSSEIYGDAVLGGVRAPVAGIAGDQQAALFGQGCTRPGMAKNTYGTGCFMLMNTGTTPVVSKNRLVTTVAWRIGKRMEYALEGSIFIAGAVVQWLRDGLGIIGSSGEVEALASSVPDSGGVHVVPAFAGLGAPHWDPHARGIITGLTRGATRAHIARAALESIAFQSADVLRAMEKDAGTRLRELRVDGGACVNNLLMQVQADLIGAPVVRPRMAETTALGAAYLAGLAVGFWNSAELAGQRNVERRFTPRLRRAARAKAFGGWQDALGRAMR
jgi:glycerol kinase